jgi:hypothetical protein
VNADVGMLGLEGLKQAQRELCYGGIQRVGSRFARPLCCGDTPPLEGFVRSLPRTELRSGLIEDNAHGNRDFWGHE